MEDHRAPLPFVAFLLHLKEQVKSLGPCAIDILPGNAEHPFMLQVRELYRIDDKP